MSSKVSALTSATPLGSDYVYLVDDPAGTASSKRATVSDLLGVAQGSFKNVTDADTGIAADGTTDDSSAIGTLLSAGGSFYFPPGNYHLGAGVNITHTNDIEVVCAAGVVFSTNGESIADDLFDVTTSANAQVKFVWRGGAFNAEGVESSTSLGANESVGGYFNTDASTPSTTSVFDFRDGYWSVIDLSQMLFVNRTNGLASQDWREVANHYMGNLSAGYTPGGDSAITANAGPGDTYIRDCTIVGFKDAAIYISGQGGGEARDSRQVYIDGVSAYHCGDGITFKADGDYGGTVSNCYAYQCGKGFFNGATTTNPSTDRVTWINCVAERCATGFRAKQTKQSRFINCVNREPWWADWAGSYRGSSSKLTIATNDTETVTQITVNSVNMMDGTTETQSGTGAAARITFANDIATNINAHTPVSGPDVKAGVWYDGTNVFLILTTASDAAEIDTTTITPSGTGAGNITAPDMEFHHDVWYGVDIEGCVGTMVDGFHQISQDATQAVIGGVRTLSTSSQAFRIRSMTTDTTIDTTIANAVLDHGGIVGGEATVGGATDPTDTRVLGLLIRGLDDTSGFDLIDGSCDYRDRIEVVLASNHTSDDDTLSADDEVAGFSWSLASDATYAMEGLLIVDALDTVDIKVDWDGGSGADTGYWAMIGPSQASTKTSYDSGLNLINMHALGWNETLNGIGGTSTDDIGIFPIHGTVTTAAARTLQMRFSQRTADVANPATLYAGSRVLFRRIG